MKEEKKEGLGYKFLEKLLISGADALGKAVIDKASKVLDKYYFAKDEDDKKEDKEKKDEKVDS